MKKLMIIAALAVGIATFVGCKSIPDTGSMYNTSYMFGATTGLVCNQTKIDDTSRNTVIEIMNIVDDCVPATNETFEVAWTPIAKAHTQKLIDEGKIDAKQGELIIMAFATVTKGIDYLFDVRYPKARQYTELVEAAIHGFSDGFLTVFKPADTFAESIAIPVDRGLYKYLMDSQKK